jgi:hypothetical protein
VDLARLIDDEGKYSDREDHALESGKQYRSLILICAKMIQAGFE